MPRGTLVLASRNEKKLEELSALLAGSGLVLLSPADFPELLELPETGQSFAENARLKAEAALRHTGLAALADDSGLEVDALDGAPGILSARFAGEGADDAANNALLLRRLEGLPRERRGAHFTCVLALALPGRPVRLFEGRADGRILARARGRGGFGYDPLFFSSDLNKTFAEAAPAEKNEASHRARALRAFARALQEEGPLA
ncbi:MAG: RdgB/HAM1 family non-canonical purine NTP pyrophosphatase [Planctomycetota bacterium]